MMKFSGPIFTISCAAARRSSFWRITWSESQRTGREMWNATLPNVIRNELILSATFSERWKCPISKRPRIFAFIAYHITNSCEATV